MTVYKRFIRPVMLAPASTNDYSQERVLIEPEKWYPEEERETLTRKYKHFETTFEKLVFEDKYEEIEIPEIVRCEYCRYWLPMNRFKPDYQPGKGECELNCWVRDFDWFCADGKVREKRDQEVK